MADDAEENVCVCKKIRGSEEDLLEDERFRVEDEKDEWLGEEEEDSGEEDYDLALKRKAIAERMSRKYNCLKELTRCSDICPTPSSQASSVDGERRGDHWSYETQRPTSENIVREPPKYLRTQQVWEQKNLTRRNVYREFIDKTKNPKWHPHWKPPKPPAGWALYQAQVDELLDELARWMKQELETPGYKSSCTLHPDSLRQLFEIDLQGQAAKKLKVIPRELRCIRNPVWSKKHSEKVNPLPPEMDMLRKVKDLALGDIKAASSRQDHAFLTHLPVDHPRRHRPKKTIEMRRWIEARSAHKDITCWSNVLQSMNDTKIGCAFGHYVAVNMPYISRKVWPKKAALAVCQWTQGLSKLRVVSGTSPVRLVHRDPSISEIGADFLSTDGVFFDKFVTQSTQGDQ